MFISMIWARKNIISEKKQRKETSQTPKTMQPIMPWGKTTASCKSCAARGLKHRQLIKPITKLRTHVQVMCQAKYFILISK